MKLIDKETAIVQLARMTATGQHLNISISEDICFADDQGEKWIDLGKVKLHVGLQTDEQQERYYDHECAIRFGGFEWDIPDRTALDLSVDAALPHSFKPELRSRVKKAVHEGLQDIARRTLLCFPVFDADTLALLPLRRPTTIVPDTTAVHQGALDFVCRFLSPWVRVKVPAIVHMEILTNVDNYLKGIRFAPDKDREARRCASIRQHLLSQGGQRTLLRMELNPEIEIDRGDLGADPLRGIVTPSSDPEDKRLNLQNIVQSFADRLIVETARRFQFEVRPDHPLFILTSDQGMAKMAISEGLGLCFFQSRSAPNVEGQTLTGALHHPFCPEIYTVSLVDVFWELAVSFGRLKVTTDKEAGALDLWGIGGDSEGVTWQPLHSREDLLWAKIEIPQVSKHVSEVESYEEARKAKAKDLTAVSENNHDREGQPTNEKQHIAQKGQPWYKFSPNKMFSLIRYLVQRKRLQRGEAQALIELQSLDTFFKYERFLRSGGLVSGEGVELVSTEMLEQLWAGLRVGDTEQSLRVLRLIPSFELLFQFIQNEGTAKIDDLPAPQSVHGTYLAVGESLCVWLRIPGIGVVSTLHKPSDADFVTTAVSCYQILKETDGTEWVLTGRWLEYLAEQYRIHPIITKQMLDKARETEQIQLYAEGSTPDTRFEEHYFWTLLLRDEMPFLERTFLYHGDFLLHGTSAVRIKLQEPNYAS